LEKTAEHRSSENWLGLTPSELGLTSAELGLTPAELGLTPTEDTQRKIVLVEI
jgi:hypothetical protein